MYTYCICTNTVHAHTKCMYTYCTCTNTVHAHTKCMYTYCICTNTVHINIQCMYIYSAAAYTVYVLTVDVLCVHIRCVHVHTQYSVLARLQQWPCYLQGPGFNSHLQPGEFSACNKVSPLKKINQICAMHSNNLA